MTHKEATLSMKHAHGTPLMIALVAAYLSEPF